MEIGLAVERRALETLETLETERVRARTGCAIDVNVACKTHHKQGEKETSFHCQSQPHRTAGVQQKSHEFRSVREREVGCDMGSWAAAGEC
jgi:hypothetical protein